MTLRHLAIYRMRLALALALLWPLLADAQGGSTPLLYEVRSATATVYLFGTVHVGTRALYPLSPAVEDAFTHAKALALEANPLNQQDVMAAMAGATYKAPDQLGRHVSPELLSRVDVLAPRIGLPVEYAHQMKPHLLAMTLAMMEIQRLGYDPMLGLDVYLARRATKAELPIIELESMRMQLELFDGLPAEAQQAMLEQAVDGVEDGSMQEDLDALLAAWSAGDAEGIHASIERETEDLPEAVAQELRASVYDRRNERMAEKVAELLSAGDTVFVAVGAGHLIGKTGIPALLEQRGFNVQRR